MERTHLARTTVHRALTGESALPVEVLIPLAMGMGVDLRTLMDLAAAHGDEGDIDPTSR